MGKKAKAHEDRLLLKLRSGEVSPTQRFCDVCSRSDQYTLNTLFEKANPMISDKFYDIAFALKDAWQLENDINGNDPPHELPENFYHEAAGEIESAIKAFDDFEKMPIVEIYASMLGVPGLEELQNAINGGQTERQRDESGITQRLDDIQADTTGTAIKMSEVDNKLSFLVADRMRKIKRNTERGKENQAIGNDEERQRAADDMKTALNRVRDRMKNGATNVLAECRKVCKDFKPLTTKKNALGKCAEYAPLTSSSGEAVKPETLAKNYRARFGTKQAHKSGVKKRTKWQTLAL